MRVALAAVEVAAIVSPLAKFVSIIPTDGVVRRGGASSSTNCWRVESTVTMDEAIVNAGNLDEAVCS
jgi:hypothetical protein